MAINIVDRYFSETFNLPKADFQLAGATALFITSKLDLHDPISSKEFAKSTKNRYTSLKILEMERKISKVQYCLFRLYSIF